MTVCSQGKEKSLGKLSRGVKNMVGLLFPSLVLEVCCIRCWDAGGAYQGAPGPETGVYHLPGTLKGFAMLGSSVGLRGFCQFSFTCTVLLGKLFVPCPFLVKCLWGLVVFSLGSVPSSGLSGSDTDRCSRCKPLQVLWELALSPEEIIFSSPSEVNIRVISDRKNSAQVK